jgi:hypothetical protein
VKPIIWWSVGVLAGLLCVFGSLTGAVLAKPSSEVLCGHEVMAPADTCEQDDHGSKHTYTYAEMKSKNVSDTAVGGWVGLAMGVALTALSVVKLIQALRRRRAGPQQWPQVAQSPPPQPPQWYQQPPPPAPQSQPQPYYQPPQNFGPNGS